MALALLSLCHAHAPAAEVDREQAVFALTAMKDSRERLISGVFRASGRVQSGDNVRALDVYQAFDYSADLYRIDQTETVVGDRARQQADPRRNVTTRKYARNPDASTHFLGHHDVVIERPEHPPQPSVKRFDVRMLGIIHWSDFAHDGTFEDLCSFLLQQRITEFSQDEDGLIKIAWEFGESREARLSMWLDSDRGHSAVRLELRIREGEDGDGSAVKFTSEATWEEIAGVWVPKTYVHEDHYNSPKKYELAFDWESVNEPVADELFTWHAFDLPIGTIVVDNRLQRPIRLGRVGEFVAPLETAAANANRTRLGFIVFGGAVLAILLLVFRRWQVGRART